jgi:hypothetical protein
VSYYHQTLHDVPLKNNLLNLEINLEKKHSGQVVPPLQYPRYAKNKDGLSF